MGKPKTGKTSRTVRPGTRISREATLPGAAAGQETFLPPARPPSPYDELGSLPASYGDDQLYLVARDPELLFTYWDIAPDHYPTHTRSYLRLFNGTGQEEVYRTEIHAAAGHWTIPVGRGGATFCAEVGYFTRRQNWKRLARSNPAATQATGLSPARDDQFATLPYHLAFQEALELVSQARQPGEPLLATLSRIQAHAAPLRSLLPPDARREDPERLLLATLLGEPCPERLPRDPAALDARLREELARHLHSGPALDTGTLLTLAAAHTSSSWAGAAGAWSAVVASFGLSGQAPWSLEGVGTSAGFATSSPGGSASWGSHPGRTTAASAAGAASGGFHFHLDAEVICHGVTQPGSRVWINGAEVPLQGDGSFRIHYRLPDGPLTVPVVVESADGGEIRSATLRLDRKTHGP